MVDTSLGRFEITLLGANAPQTVCNFLQYVSGGYFDGGSFFRVVHNPKHEPTGIDVIQAKVRDEKFESVFPPIPLETTRKTGLSHLAGEVSMARGGPDTATSSFFIVVRTSKSLDFGGSRNPDHLGFAAFGAVSSGFSVVQSIYRARKNGDYLRVPIAIRAIKVVSEPERCDGAGRQQK